jgi:hypothetical protein
MRDSVIGDPMKALKGEGLMKYARVAASFAEGNRNRIPIGVYFGHKVSRSRRSAVVGASRSDGIPSFLLYVQRPDSRATISPNYCRPGKLNFSGSAPTITCLYF